MSKIWGFIFILALRSLHQYFTSIINLVPHRGGGTSIEGQNHSVQKGSRDHKAPHKIIRAAKHQVWEPPSLLCTGGSCPAAEAAKA